MFMSPQKTTTGFFIANSMTYVFLSFQPPYFYPWEGHKHGVSVHSLINLGKTFLQISPVWNIPQTVWIFIFFYLFDNWLYLWNGFDGGVTVKTGNSLPVSVNKRKTTLTLPKALINQVLGLSLATGNEYGKDVKMVQIFYVLFYKYS